MRSAARRVEEKFMGEFEKKGRVVLWTNSAIGCRVMGAGIAQLRSHCHISKVPRMWQGGCYTEDNWGQGVLPHWKREKIS